MHEAGHESSPSGQKSTSSRMAGRDTAILTHLVSGASPKAIAWDSPKRNQVRQGRGRGSFWKVSSQTADKTRLIQEERLGINCCRVRMTCQECGRESLNEKINSIREELEDSESKERTKMSSESEEQVKEYLKQLWEAQQHVLELSNKLSSFVEQNLSLLERQLDGLTKRIGILEKISLTTCSNASMHHCLIVNANVLHHSL